MKVGRNDPCPCGSGKKYKKCCLDKDKIPYYNEISKISEVLERNLRIRKIALEKIGIYIDFVIPTTFKDKKVFALGSRLYPNQPKNSTFHEFIIYVLQQEMGRDWWESQQALEEAEQHYIFRCFRRFHEWSLENETQDNKYGEGWRAIPDGMTKSLLTLAFDVCSLLHAVHVPDDFLSRLRQKENYQGVRYEIAIAAIFARLGYKIQFLDEASLGSSEQPMHCEFIATKENIDEKIAVEVKSKTREGVLHQKGTFDQEKELKSSVNKMYRNALKQNPGGMPFIICIDVNLPISKGVDAPDVEWMKIINKMQDKKKKAMGSKPDPCTLKVFTNYSFHYDMKDQATGRGEGMVDTPNNPEYPLKDKEFLGKLLINLNNYGVVPNLDELIEKESNLY